MTEDDAVEMIYEHQEEQLALDTVDKLENRETHSVLAVYYTQLTLPTKA